MSSRQDEKQRRRAAREAHERELAGRERRTRRLQLTGATALALVVLAGLAALTTVGNGSRTDEVLAGASRPFGQHYDGLEQRRVAAGVSTMAAPSADVHTHPRLAVWANGRRVPVPADIGIDPRRNPGQMAGLHTHEDDGTIHNEGQADATLGQFFAVWGVPFSTDASGPTAPVRTASCSCGSTTSHRPRSGRSSSPTARTSASPSAQSAPRPRPPDRDLQAPPGAARASPCRAGVAAACAT